jgi:hypothetical protein
VTKMRRVEGASKEAEAPGCHAQSVERDCLAPLSAPTLG